MKVVHALGWYFPDSLGGTEIYVAGLCRRLRAAGYDVAVAAPEAGRTGTAEYEHDGIPVFRYPVPLEPTREEAQGTMPARGAEAFHTWLSRTGADVLHVHSLVTGLGLFELRAARALQIPIVLTHHLPSLGYVCRMGTLVEQNLHPCDGIAELTRCSRCVLVARGLPLAVARPLAVLPTGVSAVLGGIPGALGTALGMTASIDRDRLRRIELNSLVDYQVVLNEAGRKILIAGGAPADRVVLNRLGIDHQGGARKASPSDAPTRPPVRVGYLGRIDGPKGVRELLQAVRRLPASASLTLEVVGPPPAASAAGLAEELRQIAAGDARISFRPAISSSEVPALLATWDVLCCPSTGFENGPTVALEAMAVGTPVIGSRIGNLAEIIDDGVTGRLVPPSDADALASALREVVDRPEATIDRWRAALGAQRSLNQIATDYQALYARLDLRQARAS